VRPEAFQGARAADGPPWAAGSRIVLSVGAVKERKGHDVTLEAVALARKEAPDLHFVLIGATEESASYAQDLRQRADGLGMTNSLHMLGRVPFEQLARWYQRADVFVLLPRDRENSLRDSDWSTSNRPPPVCRYRRQKVGRERSDCRRRNRTAWSSRMIRRRRPKLSCAFRAMKRCGPGWGKPGGSGLGSCPGRTSPTGWKIPTLRCFQTTAGPGVANDTRRDQPSAGALP